ncbi:hypothetical protein AB3S75_021166 [Citrus x aurantiifolia]
MLHNCHNQLHMHSINCTSLHQQVLLDIPIEEVFENLKCLTSDDVKERLNLFGYNRLEGKKESKILKFLGCMCNPLSWVMEAAAIMAIALAHIGGKDPDYHDFIGIVIIINDSILPPVSKKKTMLEMQQLLLWLSWPQKPRSYLRDGRWNEEDAAEMVPGDIISIKLGEIVSADARLVEGDPLKIDRLLQDSLFQ